MTKRETRSIEIELRADVAGRKIEGYAALFNTPTMIGDWFREEIAPGAFRKAIRRDDVRALINHDSNLLLGRNRAGTLRLAEDSTGLHIEIDPPDTTTARDLMVSMERGDINQMSYGFQPDVETWDLTEDIPHRLLNDVVLFDVSVVTYPATIETSASLRSLDAARQAAAPLLVTPGAMTRVRLKSGLLARL